MLIARACLFYNMLGERLIYFSGSYSLRARDHFPVPGECWINVVDAGPALSRRWAGFSCLLGTCVVRISLTLFSLIDTWFNPTYKPLGLGTTNLIYMLCLQNYMIFMSV